MAHAQQSNIVRINPNSRPLTHRGFDPMDSRSRLADAARREIMGGGTYKTIAEKAGVSPSTVCNFATGRTKWPRKLFHMLHAVGYTLELTPLKGRK